jgi:hypothetical protein
MTRLLLLIGILAVVAAVIAYTPIGVVFGIMAALIGGLGLGDPAFALAMQGLFFAPYVVGGTFVSFVIADRVTS